MSTQTREWYGRPETEDEREAVERARYFVREHDLRKAIALAAAWRQMGYSSAGIAKRIGSTESTVANYIDAIEDEFGLQAVMPKAERNRTGPLGSGVVETGVGPDEHEDRIENRSTPDLSDDSRTIPEAFLKREQWLIRNGKVPMAPWAAGKGIDRGSGGDDPTNQQLWTDFETVDRYLDKLPSWGLYFVLHPPDPFAGIDLDDCRDPETGDIDEWAEEIVDRLDAFTEISPSGEGLHIYVRGSLPAGLENDTKGVELYDDSQLTMTGDHLPGTPTAVPERQDVLDELVDEYMTESVVTDVVIPDEYNDDRDPFSPFDELTVHDVYPGIALGTNVHHPEHESTSGQNFRIHEHGKTAICWTADHQYGKKEGCGLNAHHLLALRATESENCAKTRKQWADDDELVFETWVHTLENEDHIDLDPSPPPWRVVRHIDASEDGLGILDNGGESSYLAFRFACRVLRMDYDIPVEIDDEDEDGGGWK